MSSVNFLLDRYDIHISTDRPIYNLEEWVLIRAVVLNGITNHPLPDQFKPTFTIKISSPKGDEVAKFTSVPIQNSVVVGSWKTTNDSPGGDYKISVSVEESSSDMVFAKAERSFEVREFSAPKLKLQAEFVKKGLGAGDTAVAVLNAVRAEGGIPAGAKVTATARIDGAEAWRGETTLDQKGDCRVTFKLPDDIKVGEGTLTFTVQDGGNVESIGKTIPILLATIKVNFYPESGQLVNGIESGLYFECFQTNGDPADVKGQLLSIASTTARASGFSAAATIENLEKFTRVCELESSHEGRGKVVFAPEKHNTYFMHVTTPGGIRDLIKLPRETCKVHKRGAIVRSNKDTYQKGEPVELTVVSNETDDYTLKLYKRDFELASAPVKSKGTRVITFYPPAAAGEGVLRATLFKKSTPVAERLIFRHLARQIKVKIAPNKESFKPNQKLEVKVTTTNEFDEPVKAVLGVTVADDAILEMVEKRKKAPRLPEMALLESEVNELWDSSVYFKEEPKSHKAIDMLLGTQGWRRFLFFKSEPEMLTFLKENDAAERVLVSTENSLKGIRVAPPPPPPTPAYGPYGSYPVPSPPPPGGGPMPSGVGRGYSAPKRSSVLSQVQSGAKLSVKSKPTTALSPRSESEAQPTSNSRAKISPRANINIAPSAPAPRMSAEMAPSPSRSMAPMASMAPPMSPMAPLLSSMAPPSAGARPSYMSMPPPPPPGYYGSPAPPPPEPRPAVKDNEEIVFVNAGRGYVVREYKHKKSVSRDKTTRTDFTKTLYWHGGLATNDKGEATVTFTLSESITSFRVMVDAFNRNNGFGVNDFLIESKEPFSSDARVPIEVTEGDEILLPILLVNNTKKTFSEAKVAIDTDPALQVDAKKASEFKSIKIAGNQRVRKLLKLKAESPGKAKVHLEAKSGSGHLDKIERHMRIMPLGFPQQFDASHTLSSKDGENEIEFEIPSNISKSSLTASLAFFPSPAGSFEALCDRLCQTPGGCFEQVGSTMFPLVLAAQWYANKGDLNKLGQFTPKIKTGYDKIKGYEVRGGGFEWYGGTPAHTALTAFGVIMLQETMPVFDIDKGLLDRSVQWLLDQRDGKGEFKQSHGKYAWASPPKDAAHAYIMWAVTESGVSAGKLEKEMEHLNKLAGQGHSYVVALAAIVNHRVKQSEQAKKWADKLVELQDKKGNVTKPGSTIVYSGNAEVESTALSMIAWMKIDAKTYGTNIELAKRFLDSSLSPYGYGNTQGTSLTLKAINMYNTDFAPAPTEGAPVLHVSLNGKVVEEKTVNLSVSTPIHISFEGVKISSGKHKLQLKLSNGVLPYQFTVSYNALTPNSAADCAVKLEAKLGKKTVNEGEGCEVMVKVTNLTKEDLPMVLAIIGLPGGFEPRHEQLKDLVKKEKIDFYEVIGRNIALYWRGFDKAGVAEFPVDVVATVPGSYTGPASRVFLYYTPEKQHWIDGLAGEIVPK